MIKQDVFYQVIIIYMKKLISKIENYCIPLLIFIFSIFVNRSLTTDSHSLGENLQNYSEIFPLQDGILQPQRILLPILGKLLNTDLQILNLLFLIIFIYIFYNHLLKTQSKLNSILITLGLSSSMFVQFHLNFGGYPDILSYLLLLIAFVYKHRTVTPYVLLLLALTTKETVIFTFLFFISLKAISKLKIFVVAVIYLPFYFTLSNGVFDFNFYIQPLKSNIFYWASQSIDFLITGYFSTIKFLWLIIFLFFIRHFKETTPLILLIFGISLQVLIGGDTTRLISFIFLGLLYVLECMNLKKDTGFLLLITLLNIFTKKCYVFFGQLTIINESRLSPIDFFQIFN